MKTLLKIFGAIIFFAALWGVTLKLFAPEFLNNLLKNISDNTRLAEKEQIVVVYADPMSSLEPTKYDVPNRSRMVNVFEGLVRLDRNLKIQPALAISWGMIDEVTWEFKLRPNVRFHNGDRMTAEDVIASLERSRDYEKSEVASLASDIEKIEIVDNSKIIIKTEVPDSILLNKLSALFIVPEKLIDNLEENPIGTGPYFIKEWEIDNYLRLKRFKDYWGEKPKYENVLLQTIVDRDDRIQATVDGEVDILMNVPPSFVDFLGRYRMVMKVKPSLEVNFLMFDIEDSDNIFAKRELREAIRYAIDKDIFASLSDGYAHPVSQFVNKGILGYSSDIEDTSYDLNKAKSLFKKVEGFTRLKVMLDLAEGLDIFGEYVGGQLAELGIGVTLNFMSLGDLKKKITSGDSQFYFFGWRSELGDALGFYKSVVHSKTSDGQYGQYNGGNYKNEQVDRLIEEAEKNTDYELRSNQLREVMRIIVEEDILGIPLFESEVIYGVKDYLKWEPRVDGYIVISEIH